MGEIADSMLNGEMSEITIQDSGGCWQVKNDDAITVAKTIGGHVRYYEDSDDCHFLIACEDLDHVIRHLHKKGFCVVIPIVKGKAGE